MSSDNQENNLVLIYSEGLNGILSALYLQKQGHDCVLALSPKAARPMAFFPTFIEKDFLDSFDDSHKQWAGSIHDDHSRLFLKDDGQETGWKRLTDLQRQENAVLCSDQLEKIKDIISHCIDIHPRSYSIGENDLYMLLLFSQALAKEKHFTQDYLKRLVQGFSDEDYKPDEQLELFWTLPFLMKSWDKNAGLALIQSCFYKKTDHYAFYGDHRPLFDALCKDFQEAGGKILNTENYEHLEIIHKNHSFLKLRTNKFELPLKKVLVDANWQRFKNKFLNPDDLSQSLKLEMNPPIPSLSFLYFEAQIEDENDYFEPGSVYWSLPNNRQGERALVGRLMNDVLPEDPILALIKDHKNHVFCLAYPFSACPESALPNDYQDSLGHIFSDKIKMMSNDQASLDPGSFQKFSYSKGLYNPYNMKAFGRNPFLHRDEFFGHYFHNEISPSPILGDNLYFISEGLSPTTALKNCLHDFLQGLSQRL